MLMTLPTVSQRVAAAQIKSVFDMLAIHIVAAPPIVALIACLFWGEAPIATLLSWIGLVIVAMANVLIWILLYRSKRRSNFDIRFWKNGLRFAAAVSGFSWGSSAFLFMPMH